MRRVADGTASMRDVVWPAATTSAPRPTAAPNVGYSRDAEQECAAFHRRTGRIIKLLTVQEILDEEHVQKM